MQATINVTNHSLNIDNIAEVVEGGRCRWKTENENHNVLKTKGYKLGHNFGHGQKHLSSTLLSLNLLAFVPYFIDWHYHPLIFTAAAVTGLLIPGILLNKYNNWLKLNPNYILNELFSPKNLITIIKYINIYIPGF